MAKEPEFPYGVCLTVAYEGTAFHGWQSQEGFRTVQATIEEAIDKLGVEHSALRGASRTDAGVHALGQIAAFGCKTEIPPEGWVRGLNDILPGDVLICEASACFRRFNPRWHASQKRYRYVLHCGELRDPFTRNTAWHLWPSECRKDVRGQKSRVADYLDVEAMKAAAAHLVGTHDFRAFRGRGDERATTERTLPSVDVITPWKGRDDMLAIEVVGTAFLKNMVRILAGTLVDVGAKRRSADSIPPLLMDTATRGDAGQTAPPHGLTLIDIELGRDMPVV